MKNKMKIKLFLISLLSLSCLLTFAQQEINFSQSFSKNRIVQRRNKRLNNLKDDQYFNNKKKLIASICGQKFNKLFKCNSITCFGDYKIKTIFYNPFNYEINFQVVQVSSSSFKMIYFNKQWDF